MTLSSPSGAEEGRGRDGALPARLYACCVLSGGAALTYEVVWNRELLAVFGSTTWSTAAVLAAFLGGMAAGSAAVARFAGRIRRPLVAYACAELGVAAYALLFGPLLAAAAVPYGRVWERLGESPAALLSGPLAVGAPLVLLPAAALGAALPLLAEALERCGHAGPGHAGRLYGFNTAGAMLGAVGAGFLLLPFLGMEGALGVAMALNAAAALVALDARRRAPGRRPRDEGARTGRSEGPASGASPSPLLPAVVLLSSAAALGYEVVWTRILVLVTGSSTYAFSLVLAVFVGGLAWGSLWMARRADRVRNAGLALSHLLVAAALTALGALYLAGRLPELFLHGFAGAGRSGAMWLLQAGLAALVLVPSTFFLGAVFPVAVRLAGRGGGRLGRPVGRVYAWMATGNVLGVLLAAGLAVPVFGLQGGVASLALLSLAAGILSLELQRLPPRTRALTAAGSILSCGLLWGLRPAWDPVVMTSGVYRDAPRYLELAGSPEGLERILGSYRLVLYREGLQSVVSVTERPSLARERYLALAVDGKVDASSGSDMSTQVLSAHLPLFVHPDPRRVLTVGLASGVTVGSSARHALERIDVVEIEPAMAEAARVFADFNGDALADPRVRLHLDDGRHFLAVTRASFDVIVSEPSNPWMSGPSRLFTREFFDLARTRLAPGGVMAQWVPLYGLAPEHFRSLVRTFLDVFPHALAFRVAAGDVLLLGSDAPLRIDRERFEALWRGQPIQHDLRRVGIGSPAELAATWVGGERELRKLAGPGRLNTDRNGLLEFGAPKALHGNTLEDNAALLEGASGPASVTAYLDLGAASAPEAARWIASIAAAAWEKGRETRGPGASGYAANAEIEGRPHALARKALRIADVPEARYLLARIEATSGKDSLARKHWEAAATARHAPSLLALARSALERGDVRHGERLLTRVPPEARTEAHGYLRAVSLLSADEAEAALEALTHATPAAPPDPAPADAGPGAVSLAGTYLREVAAARTGQGGRAAAAREELKARLRELRRSLEREEGQERLDRLLRDAESLLPVALSAEELRSLHDDLRTGVLTPLAFYYQGVSLLWTGHPAEAERSFERSREALDEPDPGSLSLFFLALAHRDLGRPDAARRHLLEFLEARSGGGPEGDPRRDWAVAEACRLVVEARASDPPAVCGPESPPGDGAKRAWSRAARAGAGAGHRASRRLAGRRRAPSDRKVRSTVPE